MNVCELISDLPEPRRRLVETLVTALLDIQDDDDSAKVSHVGMTEAPVSSEDEEMLEADLDGPNALDGVRCECVSR